MRKWVQPPITEATAWRRIRLGEAQEGLCPACDQPLPEDLALTEIDHIIPKILGGPNDPWNRRLVHLACNRRKRDKLTDEAIALAAEHGVTLERKIRIPRYQNEDDIPWWSFRRHMDCVRLDLETRQLHPTDEACDYHQGTVTAAEFAARFGQSA